MLLVRRVGETRDPERRLRRPGGLLHRAGRSPRASASSPRSWRWAGSWRSPPCTPRRSGLAHASLPLVVYGSTVVVGRIVFGRYVDRVPPLPLGAAALATMGLGLLVLALAPTPAGVLAGSALTAFGVVFSTPAFFSAIFATASPSERGAASGTASIALDLGLAGGPVMVGLVAEQQGIRGAFAVCTAVTVAGTAWTMLLARRAGSAAPG